MPTMTVCPAARAALALVLSFAAACDAEPSQSVDGSHDSATHDAVGSDANDRDASLTRDAATDAAADDAAANDAAPSDSGQDAASPDAATRFSWCATSSFAGSPLPSARVASRLRGGFGFVEGPVWVASIGALLFSDMDLSTGNSATGPLSQIRRFVPPSTFDVLSPSSFSNGLSLDQDGRLLAATHDVQSLSHIDPSSGARVPLSLDYNGNNFNSPNDLAIRFDGNVYFTDPDWQIGTRNSETAITGVYRMRPSGEISLVDGTLDKPNGIALSPDGSTLYVGSAGSNVLAYPVSDDGSVGSSTVFATTGSSDGLTVDCAGNLYVTSGSVEVFSANGTKLGDITLGEAPSNVAFGGTEQRTLYITARTGLYSIELLIPGLPY